VPRLARILVVLLCGALLGAAPAAAGEVFHLQKLADGVYAAIVDPNPPMYVFANSLIVINRKDVLVVDTQASPSAARALLAEIRKLTDKPVRYVVNTHWHADHIYGNQVYRDAFPRVDFIAHDTGRRDILTRGAAYVEEEKETLPPSIVQREQWLKTGIGPDGQPLTGDLRRRIERSARLRREHLAELDTLEIIPPTITFAHSLTLYCGDHVIELRYFHPAHTRGDIVVYLPQEKILAVGDLLEDAFPYFGHGYPAGWLATLKEIAAMDAEIFLPAHGSVQRDRELLDTETRLLASLVSQVQRAVADGLSLEETQKKVNLEEFRPFFTGGDPRNDPEFNQRAAEAVERAYLEATGKLEQELAGTPAEPAKP
jgi:cyclase